MKTYKYYDNGTEEVLTTKDLLIAFSMEEMAEQRNQGTTFKTWIDELLKQQILIPITE